MTATAPRFFLNAQATRRSAPEVDAWMAMATESSVLKPIRAKGVPPKGFRRKATPGDGILPDLKRYLEGCSEAYFITLTSKRRYDPISLTREIGEMLHRVNTAIYGNAYKRRKEVALITYPVQERSENQGLHTHLVVGVLDGSLSIKPNQPTASIAQLIISTWVALDPKDRRRAAQNAQEADFVLGAIGYVEKRIRNLQGVVNVDFQNCYNPKTSAAVPA